MIPSKEVFIKEWLPTLPQSDYIKEEDALNWYDQTLEIEPDRFKWHFNRLKGLGGSDIGEIACWKLDQPNIFKTPWDIIKEKLMVKGIEPQNADMRRGTYLEPIVQRIFLEDYAGEHRQDLCEAIDNSVSKEHPWMRGNVDDVVSINGLVYVVDYKCPSEIHKGTTILPYACQVHQYNYLLGQWAGFEPGQPGADGMIIAQFDYPNGVVDAVEIPFDPEIMTAVLDGGDEIWNHVLAGTFPEFQSKMKEDLEFTDAEKKQITKLEEDFVCQKLILDKVTESFNRTKSKLTWALSGNGEVLVKGQTLPINITGTIIRETIKEPQMRALLHTQGLSADTFQTPGKKYDPDKMADALAEKGDDLKDYLIAQWDIGKIKKYCDEKNLVYPIAESVSSKIQPKAFPGDKLDSLKQEAGRIVQKSFNQIRVGESDEQEQNEEDLLIFEYSDTDPQKADAQKEQILLSA